MRKFLLVLFLVGLTAPLCAQIVETLPEVEVLGLHFKYLDAMGDDLDTPVAVKRLHKKVGSYDILATDLYDHVFDEYQFTFEIPEGKILATYDKEGELLW